MVKLALQLVDRQAAPFEPSDMEDRYEARLREVIAAKLHGEGIAPAAQPPRRDNVIDLMATLKQSLQRGAESAKAPAPAKSPTKAPANEPAKPRAAAAAAKRPARKRA